MEKCPFKKWKEVFSTDRHEYGGTGLLNGGELIATEGTYHRQPYHLGIRLPWLGAVILERDFSNGDLRRSTEEYGG